MVLRETFINSNPNLMMMESPDINSADLEKVLSTIKKVECARNENASNKGFRFRGVIKDIIFPLLVVGTALYVTYRIGVSTLEQDYKDCQSIEEKSISLNNLRMWDTCQKTEEMYSYFK